MIPDTQAKPDVEAPPAMAAAPSVPITTEAPPPVVQQTTQPATALVKPPAVLVDFFEYMSNRDLFGWLTLANFVYLVEIGNIYRLNAPYMSQTQSYEVALGSVGFTCSLVVFLAEQAGKGLPAPSLTGVSLFIFLWWFAGVIVTTFFGTFLNLVTPANGYFGAVSPVQRSATYPPPPPPPPARCKNSGFRLALPRWPCSRTWPRPGRICP